MNDSNLDWGTFWLERALKLKSQTELALIALKVAQLALARSKNPHAKAAVDHAIADAEAVLADIKAQDDAREKDRLRRKAERRHSAGAAA